MDDLKLPPAANLQEAHFFILGLAVALEKAVDTLAAHAPELLEETEAASILNIKGSFGDGGTTIENEDRGLGAALKVVQHFYARARRAQSG